MANKGVLDLVSTSMNEFTSMVSFCNLKCVTDTSTVEDFFNVLKEYHFTIHHIAVACFYIEIWEKMDKRPRHFFKTGIYHDDIRSVLLDALMIVKKGKKWDRVEGWRVLEPSEYHVSKLMENRSS